ncbi:MAG: radical SAM protein [Methanomicrobia archaeon]|nr:radical SAM protein [Methanomicrobia archaeon]
MTELNAEKKAELVAIGTVNVYESLLSRISVSSAGPGTGLKSIFFSSGGHRVRLEINKDSPLKMSKANGDFIIWKDGKELVRGEIEPIFAHCPEQAYITLSERCVYDCKFCSVPKLQGKIKTLEEVVAMVEQAKKTGKLKAIALTSGIVKSPEDEIDRVIDVVNALKKYNVPIGVSVHPTKDSSQRLKDAGVVEVKYNVETMDRAIFERNCKGRKGLSLDFILDSLRDAVRVFGANRVSTNFIIGLGETDECVRAGVEYLARMGVIPILRPITIPPLRKDELEATRPSAERLLKLARMTREILDKYGLNVEEAQTMCLPCTGCDITPYRDV